MLKAIASVLAALLFIANYLSAADIPCYSVFEHTITHSSAGISNVWEDVAIDVTLIAPSGKQHTIGGFFYDTNTWKFRFAPDETGTWKWEYTINGTGKKSGAFSCVASNNPGFLKINPDNPFRWVHDNGDPFYIFGVQDCIEFSNYANTRSGLKVTIHPKKSGSGSWLDPKTGCEIAKVNTASGGTQTINVPDFKADIALKLTLQ